MSTSGRQGGGGAREDTTLKNVQRATRELDHIVDGIIRKGHKVSKEKLKQRDSSGDESASEGEKKEDGKDRQVVRLRFSGSSSNADGTVAYVYMKRKAVLHSHEDQVRLLSDPQKNNEPLLKVTVSRCDDDPDWTHMTILMMDRNDRLLAVLDLECRGEESRAIRVNGLPATPCW